MNQSEEQVRPKILPKINSYNREDLRVVNIIGMAPSARVKIPLGENWGINRAWTQGHKLDKLFMMDGVQLMCEWCLKEGINPKDFAGYVEQHPEVELINAYPEPIVLQDDNGNRREVGKCTQYPYQYAMNLIPGTFVNNSISHAICYALIQEAMGNKKVDIINLYGIELWCSFDESEYEYQRGNVDFWINYAYGAGIQVNIPAYLLFAKDTEKNLYGYKRR